PVLGGSCGAGGVPCWEHPVRGWEQAVARVQGAVPTEKHPGGQGGDSRWQYPPPPAATTLGLARWGDISLGGCIPCWGVERCRAAKSIVPPSASSRLAKGGCVPSCSGAGGRGGQAGPVHWRSGPAPAVEPLKARRDPCRKPRSPPRSLHAARTGFPGPAAIWAGGQGLGSVSVFLQPGPDERKSELLPAGWQANKELYTLRYKSTDDSRELLLKAIMVEDSMILNVMDRSSQKVADVTLTVADYINPEHLDDFHKVYKNTEELKTRIASGIIAPFGSPTEKAKREPQAEKKDPAFPRDYDPLRVPPRQPAGTREPSWPSPMGPFSVGGEDLDPLGGRGGGMIVDPLRSGFPRPGLDPSAGLPSRLPPGAVPPGARFDPFGPLGANTSGPNPDHLPPPGYEDMFM
uniref:Proteasome inhibitor PI31 subunit n=1 Tax=Apteryx owenii TaxID=8824 RepID=A0A8B9NY29_APTOW